MQMSMNGGCNPSYMHMQMLMKCLCSALGMLMHACNLGPPALRLFLRCLGRRLALYKGLHAAEARHVQKGGCQAGPDSRALRVELAEMLNIP